VSKVTAFVIRLVSFAGCLLIASCGQPQSTPGPSTVKTPNVKKDKEVVNKNTPAVTEAPKDTPAKPSKPEFKITPESIAKEIMADDKAAELKYKGKIVEIEGKIRVANQYLPVNNISLLGGKGKVGELLMLCTPTKAYEDKMLWLGCGQTVSAVGEITSISPFLVEIKECTITDKDPSPAIKLTAEQLTAEFAKNETEAKKKYRSKPLQPNDIAFALTEVVVEGTVAKVVKIKSLLIADQVPVIILTGTDGMTVTCDVNQQTWESLKVGDKVTLKGYVDTVLNKDNKTVKIDSAYLLKKG
jgi:tRNA_anti-like